MSQQTRPVRLILSALALAPLLVACGDKEPEDTAAAVVFCTSMGDECMDDDALDACIDAYNECGEDMAVMESCPLQFGC